MNQSSWQALLQSGIANFRTQQSADALKQLSAAYSMAPDNRDVRYWLGNALRMESRTNEAEDLFRQLQREYPADLDVAFALAFLLRSEGKLAQAADTLLELAKLHQADHNVLLKIAGFLRDSNCFDEAIIVLRNCLELSPGDGSLQLKLARLLQATGRFEEALEMLRLSIKSRPDQGAGWLLLAQLQQFNDSNCSDWKLIEQATQSTLGEEADMCLAFAHGKGLDDLQQWPAAWQEFERGNRLRALSQPWDRAVWKNQFSRYLHTASWQTSAAPPQARRHPVFIVGMLRSGTTLLEQMLDRHPNIHGRGELNILSHLSASYQGVDAPGKADRDLLSNELWTHLRLDGAADHFYIDKNPLNFRFIGFLLKIMPEARIIHLSRDGRDSCLSCYSQLFQHPDAAFSNSLQDLQQYYRSYRQLMQAWEPIAEGRIHRLDYQELVQSTQPSIKGILEFLGLPWDSALEISGTDARPVRTASSWQARQAPHQRSLARWRHYEPMEPEFFKTLEAIDIQAGAGLPVG